MARPPGRRIPAAAEAEGAVRRPAAAHRPDRPERVSPEGGPLIPLPGQELLPRRRRPDTPPAWTRALWHRPALSAALSGFILFTLGIRPPATGTVPDANGAPASLQAETTAQQREPVTDTAPPSPGESVRRATGTIRELARDFYDLLPRLGIALAVLIIAALIVHFARPIVLGVLRQWEKAEAVSALLGILVWLLAIGTAFSVIAGDVRALIGAVGLFGLALSWALQAPIESVTGWLMNSFKSYYRIGDRIAVGSIFGDVYKIDFLTTTVWEAGGPEKPGRGMQPTGALITFPNSEVLRSNIVNFTRFFPYIWDEIKFRVADEADLAYTSKVIERVAKAQVGPAMEGPSGEYQALLREAGLEYEIATAPEIFIVGAESWTEIIVRYLVPARERRRWASDLIAAIQTELAKPEHRETIPPGYPRMQAWIMDRPDAGTEHGRPGLGTDEQNET